MDVLHFIKSSHDALRETVLRLEGESGVKARRLVCDELVRDLQAHVTLEKDYLYPEIGGLFPGSEALVATGLAEGALLSKRAKTLQKLLQKPVSEQDGYDKRLTELKDALQRHCDQQEQNLLPKLRSAIPTQDREDLGQVFLEAKAELLAQASGAAPAPAAQGRKRA